MDFLCARTKADHQEPFAVAAEIDRAWGLGEARVGAFLMNRFWVLERSVDVQDADFLIQDVSLGNR